MTQRGPGRQQETVPDLALLLPSWELSLRAERKSAQTVKVYGDGVHRFLAWAKDSNRLAVLDRPTVIAFVADLLEKGAEPATARSRHLALRRFSAWLVEEGEAAAEERSPHSGWVSCPGRRGRSDYQDCHRGLAYKKIIMACRPLVQRQRSAAVREMTP